MGDTGVIGERAIEADLFMGEFGADLLVNLTALLIDLKRLLVDFLLLVVDIVEVLCISKCSIGDTGVISWGLISG